MLFCSLKSYNDHDEHFHRSQFIISVRTEYFMFLQYIVHNIIGPKKEVL